MDINKREELTDKSLVRVYNEYGGTVLYKTDAYSRQIPADTYRDIPLAELKDLIIINGKTKLFDKGYLVIKDNRVRELLGLELLGEYNLDKDMLKALLVEADLHKIETFLQYTSDANLDKLVRVAVETPVRNLDVANLIQAYSGINIINAIQDREEEKVAQTGVRQRVDGKAPEVPTATPVRGRIKPQS